jgi:hypothetical protein
VQRENNGSDKNMIRTISLEERVLSSEICHVVDRKSMNILGQYVSSMFMAKEQANQQTSMKENGNQMLSCRFLAWLILQL